MNLLTRKAFIALFFLACATQAVAQSIDFSSTAGFERTCRTFGGGDPAKLAADAEIVAFAICSAVSVLREGARWQQELEAGGFNQEHTVKRIRATLESMLARIAATRRALERVRSAGPYFRVQPGSWEIDLNGDGRLDPVEKYFFWVPKRELGDIARGTADAAFYEANYLPATVRVDRSDVYWAIAYCHYAEAALNLLLAYEVNLGGQSGLAIQLRDPKRVSERAYRNLGGGVAWSARLREALQKETDDDEEWIPSPAQKNSVFPLAMDVQTFVSWGLLLGHLDKLVRGRTLLGGTPRGAQDTRVRDLTMGLCAPDEGINVRELFVNPIRLPLDEREWRTKCVRSSDKVPFTGLAGLIEESLRRNAARRPGDFAGESTILRYLYWVN